jgi:hypothetical protein
MAPLLSLPLEALIHLCGHVEPADLKNLRATCRSFQMATSRLFAHEFVAHRRHLTTTKSINMLEEIVHDSYFGRFVQTIAFNCVRKTLAKDIDNTTHPLQVYPDESYEEIHAKETKIYGIISQVYKNHAQISIGLYFEYDEQTCYDLLEQVRSDTINLSLDDQPSFSFAHLRSILRLLLQMCTELHCPVDRIEIDLGKETESCLQMMRNGELDDEQSSTVFHAMEEALTNKSVLGPSLEFKYGAGDSHYKTFSFDQKSKTLKMYNSPLHLDMSPPPLAQFVGSLDILGSWLEDSRVETLDLTGAGNCNTSASSLLNVYLTPSYQSVKYLKLHRMRMRSLSTWNVLIALLSNFEALQTCELSDLASVEFSADRLKKAEFLEVLHFEAGGCKLDNQLRDLSARLQAYETTWRNEADDSSTKWAQHLGIKFDSRAIQEETRSPTEEDARGTSLIAEAALATEADQEFGTDTTSTSTSTETYSQTQDEPRPVRTEGVPEEVVNSMDSPSVLGQGAEVTAPTNGAVQPMTSDYSVPNDDDTLIIQSSRFKNNEEPSELCQHSIQPSG